MRSPSFAGTCCALLLPILALAACSAPPAPKPGQHWQGELVYFADSASFVDCTSGKRWPVAAAGDFLALQADYLKRRSAPEAPLLVNFEGRVELRESMEGPARDQMVVERFLSSSPGMSCAQLSQRRPGT
jgi:uncharacterized lipoprotein NlpE involved in copper resistance